MSRHGLNRQADISNEVQGRAYKIPKSDWQEMYFDLYRQTHGEDRTDQDVMQDAEKRRGILKRARG
jgi:hypothetical protein